MKMAAIAAAITTTLVSGSALAAEVYNSDGTSLGVGGRVEFRGDFQGRASGDELSGTMDNQSRVRINIDAKTKINDDLSGIGFYEAEQSSNSSGDNKKGTNGLEFKQRYLYAGLESNDNTITFGRQDTATVQLSQMSDNASTYSGAQKEFINAGNEQVNNTFGYSGYFMDALSLKASYVAGDKASSNGYGLSGIYTLPFGLGIGLGYAANENDGSQDSTQFIGGLNYRWNSLYVAGTYTQGEGSAKLLTSNNDYKGYELVAHYKFDSGFQAVAGYQKGEIDPEGGEKYNVSDYFELTGKYFFNNTIHSYISYKFNNLKKSDEQTKNSAGDYADAENSLRLGLRYDF
ncbi:porin [Vibrio nomapromontoriensis]|uniref:porin n=1 Tax=Vibrio nomapromontoriensis TaxID=2910246 RepID=UPI003D14B1D3